MKLRRLGGFGIAALLVAAACNPTASPAPGTPTAPPVATQPPATDAPTQAPTDAPTPGAGIPDDPLRVVTIPAGEPIHIAMWGVLTGPDQDLGIDVLRGVELGIEDRPEIAGRTVRLSQFDAGCNPEGGATAATQIVSDVTIVGLVGSVCSDETVGGIAAITAAGLTTISPSNTRPALTDPSLPGGRDDTYAGYLRTAHSDAFQGAAAADFAYNELGVRRAATIHDGTSYAEALQGVFAAEFTALGGEVTIQTAVGAQDREMGPVLTNVAATDPELIFYPVFTAPSGFITAQVRDIPGLEEVVLMGADAGFSAAMIEAAGPNAEGMYLSSPDFTAFQAGYADFLAKHTAKYGENPLQIFHAHAYDAYNILANALEQVSVEGADGSLYVPMGALRDAIFATSSHAGITGTLTCNETGDCGAPIIAVYQVTAREVGGEWPPVAPIWP